MTSFLIRSRHGTTLFFRRRVPDDLRPLFRKNYLVRSLGTASRSAAIILARQMAVKTDIAFDQLRKMPKKDPEEPLLQLDYKVAFEFDLDGILKKTTVEATPEETEHAAAFVSRAIQAAHQAQPAAALPLTPQHRRAVITPEALFDDFIAEGTATGRWKNPTTARDHDYAPVWRSFLVHAAEHGLSAAASTSYRKALLLDLSISPATKTRNVSYVKAVLKHGVENHNLDTDICNALKLPGRRGRNADTKVKSYLPFSADELKRLFHSEAYRTNSFKKASQFWLPLLGLYSGARIEELAGLHLNAFSTVDGLPVVELSSLETTDGGKNDYAPRLFPIHQALVDAGLLQYVDMLRLENFTRLFPDIQEAERDGFGKRATDDFTAYRRSVGVGADAGRSRKVFHSFRATLSGKMFELGVDGDLSRRLVGHAPSDVHAGVYLKYAAIPMDRARAAINQITFDLMHPKFIDTPAYRSSRRRKRYKART